MGLDMQSDTPLSTIESVFRFCVIFICYENLVFNALLNNDQCIQSTIARKYNFDGLLPGVKTQYA